MKEYLKIRIQKKSADLIEKELGCSAQKVGKDPYSLFDIELPLEDERWGAIKKICAQHVSFFPKLFEPFSIENAGFQSRVPKNCDVGYSIIDYYIKYTKSEIEQADCFHVILPVRPVLNRGNKEHLVYDFSEECDKCRSGWTQIGDLTFEKKTLRDSFPFFRVFGRNEYVVNLDIKTLLNEVRGVDFRNIRDIKSNEIIDSWFQLIIKEDVGHCLPQTQFGFDFLYRNPEDSFACPQGHTLGLNVLSEIFIDKGSFVNKDIAFTIDQIGGIGSVQVPTPILIISRKIYSLLHSNIKKSKISYHLVRLL